MGISLRMQTYESLERETGIEPASLAWKARVLPLNYSRKPMVCAHCRAVLNLFTLTQGGGGNWIRTSVGVSQQIYSLPPLATRASLRRDFNCSRFFESRKIFKSFSIFLGAAGGDRTHDPWLRRPILYPLSYSRCDARYTRTSKKSTAWILTCTFHQFRKIYANSFSTSNPRPLI